MLEYPAFRPKVSLLSSPCDMALILCSSTMPVITLSLARKEAFPGPDNYQKMRRSMENAETVGLYPYGPFQPVPKNTYRPQGLPTPSNYPTPNTYPAPYTYPTPSTYHATSAQPALHGPQRILFPIGTTSFADRTSTTNRALRAVTQVTMRQNAGFSVITPPGSSSSSSSPPWWKGDFADPDDPADVFNRGSSSLSASAQYSSETHISYHTTA